MICFLTYFRLRLTNLALSHQLPREVFKAQYMVPDGDLGHVRVKPPQR